MYRIDRILGKERNSAPESFFAENIPGPQNGKPSTQFSFNKVRTLILEQTLEEAQANCHPEG